MRLAAFHITQQGKSHIDNGTVCQDAGLAQVLHVNGTELAVLIAADGVGSCLYSDEGSKTAVDTLMNVLRNGIGQNTDKTDIRLLLKTGFTEALKRINELAKETRRPAEEFSTTLTCAVYDGSTVWYGHIGDSGIVAIFNDGSYRMITVRCKGQEWNMVMPLYFTDYWQFGTVENVAALCVQTDGVLDKYVDDELTDERIFFPFIEDLLTPLDSEEKLAACKKGYDDFLRSDETRKELTDDITFAAAQNTETIAAAAANVVFDNEKYNEITEAVLNYRGCRLNRHSSEHDKWLTMAMLYRLLGKEDQLPPEPENKVSTAPEKTFPQLLLKQDKCGSFSPLTMRKL